MKRIIVGILVLCIAGGGYAQQAKEVLPYDALIRSANIYLKLKDKDYPHVINLLQTAIDNYPQPLEAHFYLGLIYAEQAEYAKMMDNFRKFETICSQEAKAADKKFAKRCEKDNMPKQINDTKLAELKRGFDNGVLQIRHADSVSEVMKTETVDSVKTKQADIVKQLLAKAEGLFNDCVLIDDTIAGVWTNLALIEKKLGNTPKALEHYQRSYKLNPTDAMMVYDLASTYFDEKDFANAARYYGEFGELDKTNAEAAFINQAMCYQQLNDNAALEKSLDRILEVNPNNGEIRYQRGVMQVRNASAPVLRDSASKLDSLLEIKPNDAGLKQAKDDLIKFRQAFNEKALEDFKLAAEGNDKEPLYWYWYGNTAYFLDKQDESFEAYKKCVAADEKFKDCWCQLSILYARKGMKTEAQDAATKCEAK